MQITFARTAKRNCPPPLEMVERGREAISDVDERIKSVTKTSDVTLQINLCAGDLAYAELTIPALIATHRPAVREVLVVADACPPQSTPALHAPSRFPESAFAHRVEMLRILCSRWLRESLIDRLEWVEPGAPYIAELNSRYCGYATRWTHDHLGHAFTAYFAGWNHANTRYVLHFDADVILHQTKEYSWITAGLDVMGSDPNVLAVSPRVAPPLEHGAESMVDLSQAGNGWQQAWRLEKHPQGWRSDWFSTRCHLIDRQRLDALLPLVPARGLLRDYVSHQINRALYPLYQMRPWFSNVSKRGLSWFADRVARRIALKVIPPFPLPPEVLLYERARAAAMYCFYLGDARAWYIHPDSKPTALVNLLPKILRAVHAGEVPAAQRGFTGIRCSDWDLVDKTSHS